MYSLRSQRQRKAKDDRVLVEKNEIPSSELSSQLKLDFPVRKRRQDKAVIQKNTSPSKRDKTDAHLDCDSKLSTLDYFSKLEEAKSSFHCNPPSHLICRTKEIDCLQSFLFTHLDNHKPGSLYVSGPPGTGKTATLMHLLDQKKDLLEEVDVVVVNCMSLNTSQTIFNKIAVQLGLRRNISEKRLANYITSTKSMILLVLDEIDQCAQQVLYTLFEWPSLVGSHIILIGIANSLDLTDRILPRLKSHPHTSPDLLIFPPYTKEDIFTILKDRLSFVPGTVSVIDTTALQFCARKVAAVHGDARKALDICRRAIELFQTHRDISETIVSISHISCVIEEVCGGTVKTMVAEGIPLQQKLVACSILLMTKSKTNKEISLSKLFNVYQRICEKQSLRHESQSEFVSLLHMLEAQGIVAIKKAKEMLLQKVSLQYQESDLTHILNDQTLLASILEKGI